jgi:hypothetical protein
MMNVENETQSSTETTTETSTTETLVTETPKEETQTQAETQTETKEEVKVEPLTLDSLTIPEGFEVQAELSDKFLEILNGDSSPQDRANALLALHGETINAALEADSKAWNTMQTEWRDAAKADPDVGGDKLQSTLNNVGKLLDEFGDKEVRGVFDLTGAGNNVHMLKFLNKIADALTEGSFFKSGSPAASNEPDAAAKRMYPSMKG